MTVNAKPRRGLTEQAAAPNGGSRRRVPPAEILRAFDFAANPAVDSAVINTLATCDWVKKGLPLCPIGDSGTGKSHLLIALGTEAAVAGYRVRCTLAAKPANELVEAAGDKQLTKTINRYGRAGLLCVDESATWNPAAAAPSCSSRF